MTGSSATRSFLEVEAAARYLCVSLVGAGAAAAEPACQGNPAGHGRRGLGQRCLFLGDEPETGARETFPEGRDHRGTSRRCRRSPLRITAAQRSSRFNLP